MPHDHHHHDHDLLGTKNENFDKYLVGVRHRIEDENMEVTSISTRRHSLEHMQNCRAIYELERCPNRSTKTHRKQHRK